MRCRKLQLGPRSHPSERWPEGDQLSLGVLGLVLGDEQGCKWRRGPEAT
jgi:hypothetical protein